MYFRFKFQSKVYPDNQIWKIFLQFHMYSVFTQKSEVSEIKLFKFNNLKAVLITSNQIICQKLILWLVVILQFRVNLEQPVD